MMPDYPLEQTLDFKFTTRQFSTGAPFTLAGSPVVEIYEDNDIAQITGAETLTVDFDGVTGLNNLRIAATAANGFESGKSYAATISTGTVDSVSVVGEVVAQFSIERSPALMPTTAGRTLDVLATGEVPIDFDTSIGDLAAAQIEANALDGKGDWNIGKTGYSLAATGLDAIVSTATGMVEIAKAVWDRVLTGATHAITDSSGRRLRDLQEFGVYDGGAIFIDTVNGTAGTTDFESGTAFNAVDTIADANTLAASLGLSRFRVAPGSTITLAAAQVAQEFFGNNWTLALGSQNISNSYFHGATVSGIGTTATGAAHFNHCDVGTTSLGEVHLDACGLLTATITLTAVGDYTFSDCYSEVAGMATPIIDFGAVGNTNLTMPNYNQGVEIRNLNSTGADLFSISGKGQIIYAASSSGSVNQRGDWKVTNTGGVTITEDDNTSNISDTLTDTADIQPKIGTPAADVSADIAAVKAETALIVADTDELQGDWVDGGRLDLILDARMAEASIDTTGGAVDNVTLVDTTTVNTDMLTVASILTTQMTEAYAADGVAPTLTQALFLIQQILSDFGISGTTLTVRKIDGATTAATLTLDDGTNPTDLTRAT